MVALTTPPDSTACSALKPEDSTSPIATPPEEITAEPLLLIWTAEAMPPAKIVISPPFTTALRAVPLERA